MEIAGQARADADRTASSTNGSGCTCSPARTPSTAVRTRSSATSSPSGCSAYPGRSRDERLREDLGARTRHPPKEIEGHGLLTGKVVFVTAAAGTGIGSSTARRALAEGADVVVSDYHERRLGETRDELAALGLGRVDAVVCDVTSTEAVDALITSTTADEDGPARRPGQQRRAGRSDARRRHDRRRMGPRPQRDADLGDARHPRRAALLPRRRRTAASSSTTPACSAGARSTRSRTTPRPRPG